jgi:hypothetical protein
MTQENTSITAYADLEPMVRIQSWPFEAGKPSDHLRPDQTREDTRQPDGHGIGYCRLSQVDVCRENWTDTGMLGFYSKRCDDIDAGR